MERAQALPVVALLLFVVIGLLGLALDVGRLFVARTELSRAVDAAALAGVGELPDVATAQAVATSYVNEHVPEAVASFPGTDEEYQLRVEGTRSVDMIFMRVFGFGSIDVTAEATAGFGVPLDVVFVMDDTGTMKSGCNSSQTNDDCPIKQAKDAANAFVDDLLGSSPTGVVRLGMLPFRGCYGTARYNPVSGEDPDRGCTLFSEFQGLTTNATALHDAINHVEAKGGFPGTNICAGLDEGLNMVTGAGSRPNARKVIVILADGDNRYSDGAQSSLRGNPTPNVYPPPSNGGSGDCRPSGPDQNSTNYGSDYDTRIGNLDTLTYQKAQEIKDAGIEIYVAGYKLAGNEGASQSTCNPGQIGTGGDRANSTSDPADRNLNKCIATSTGGTNDHYLEAPTSEDIPDVFDAIAESIAFRLIE
jgi:hypothetical protein